MWILKDAARAASVRHLNLNLVLRRLSSALSHNADDRHTSKLQKVSPSSSVPPSSVLSPSSSVFDGNCIRSTGESCNMCLMRRSPLQKLFYYRRDIELKVKAVNRPNKRKHLSLLFQACGKCGRIGLCKYRNSFLIKGAYLISG